MSDAFLAKSEFCIETDSFSILYGDTDTRADTNLNAAIRLDWISKEVEELEQAKSHATLSASDIPKDFFALLEEGMPADERVPRLIEVLGGRWLPNTSIRYGPKELQMIFKMLAWGPMTIAASMSDRQPMDTIIDTWVNLIEAALRLTSRPPFDWHRKLEQALQQLIDQHELPFKDYLDLIALERNNVYSPDDVALSVYGQVHCQSSDPDKTLCGREIIDRDSPLCEGQASWQSLPRVREDDPEPDCPKCLHRLCHPDGILPAYKPLNAAELAARALAGVREERVKTWAELIDPEVKRTPDQVEVELRTLLWRDALASLPLEKPLDGASEKELIALDPLR